MLAELLQVAISPQSNVGLTIAQVGAGVSGIAIMVGGGAIAWFKLNGRVSKHEDRLTLLEEGHEESQKHNEYLFEKMFEKFDQQGKMLNEINVEVKQHNARHEGLK